MDLLTIGGVALPAPTEYNVSKSDIDGANSGRSESGYMQRDRVRSNVNSITASWKNLTSEELRKITNATAPATVSVSYFDGSISTGRFYAGDRELTLKSLDSKNAPRWDLSFKLVEV